MLGEADAVGGQEDLARNGLTRRGTHAARNSGSGLFVSDGSDDDVDASVGKLI